jgi:glutamate/tyrosine decarboxylase-like PLP-dependent enzyme
MREEIIRLEQSARLLEPSREIRNNWNNRVIEYGSDFLENIEKANAYHADDSESIDIQKLEFGKKGKSLDSILGMLSHSLDTPGINPASGGHLGYIPGGGIYPSALADYLVDITNRYAGIYFANPGAVRMENKLIRWMCNLIGYPKSSHGNLASGGSIANLIAITAARDKKQIKPDKIARSVIYLSEQTHHCVHKAIQIEGLQEAIIRKVPLDAAYRMDVKKLQSIVDRDKSKGLSPFMVVCSLGSTDTGAIDPVNEIADLTEQENIWLHIDAAYGGFFILVDELKHHFEGIGRSDSYVVDPHKGLFLPYGTGAVLVRDGQALKDAHVYRANYMQDARDHPSELSPADLSPELTKHFRGLRMWLPLHLFGLDAFKAAIKEKWLLCQYFYLEVEELGFEVGPKPDLSVAIYRYVPKDREANEFNRSLINEVQNDGRIFISSTTIRGEFWLRAAILCFRTHINTVDLLLRILTEKKALLLSKHT